jgi:hypothetical protein
MLTTDILYQADGVEAYRCRLPAGESVLIDSSVVTRATDQNAYRVFHQGVMEVFNEDGELFAERLPFESSLNVIDTPVTWDYTVCRARDEDNVFTCIHKVPSGKVHVLEHRMKQGDSIALSGKYFLVVSGSVESGEGVFDALHFGVIGSAKTFTARVDTFVAEVL